MRALAHVNRTLICKALREKIYEKTVSGVKDDTIIVWNLDRLGRSLKHIVALVQVIIQTNIGICSLNDPIDTTTSQSQLIINIFASLDKQN